LPAGSRAPASSSSTSSAGRRSRHGDSASPDPAAGTGFLAQTDLGALVDALRAEGRAVIAPTVEDGAIVYDEISSAADLPIGWRDEQAPGRYRIEQGVDQRAFGYTVGPTSWKRYTFPSRVPVGRARLDGDRTTFEPVEPETRPLAFLGVRGCELAALRVQDRVLMEGPVVDPDYAARRRAALVVGRRVHGRRCHLLLYFDGHLARRSPATTRTSC
jgi:hypothetical protein